MLVPLPMRRVRGLCVETGDSTDRAPTLAVRERFDALTAADMGQTAAEWLHAA